MPIQNNYSNLTNSFRRFSAHAVIGGVLAIYASMVVLMSLAGGFGLWEFNLHQLSDLGTGFWVWALTSWVICVYAGGFLASTISRFTDRRDGVIQGVVIWAAACVSGCLFLAYTTQTAEHVMSRGMLWGGFLGDSLALVAAILGGIAGSNSEAQSALTSGTKSIGVPKLHSPVIRVS